MLQSLKLHSVGLVPRRARLGSLSRRLVLPTASLSQTRASSSNTKPCCSMTAPSSPVSLRFWASSSAWRRAAVNTARCLVGCTLGDFSSMWYLQSFHPDLGIGPIMAISMASGIATSVLLETTLLRFGPDKLSWPVAAQTAVGMSFISMLTMEMAQNVVDYHLTAGVVQFESPAFWLAAAVSMGAGFLVPMPYNYYRLRRHGKACH